MEHAVFAHKYLNTSNRSGFCSLNGWSCTSTNDSVYADVCQSMRVDLLFENYLPNSDNNYVFLCRSFSVSGTHFFVLQLRLLPAFQIRMVCIICKGASTSINFAQLWETRANVSNFRRFWYFWMSCATQTPFLADIKTLTSNLCSPSSNSARIKLSPFESLLPRRRRSHHRRKRT